MFPKDGTIRSHLSLTKKKSLHHWLSELEIQGKEQKPGCWDLFAGSGFYRMAKRGQIRDKPRSRILVDCSGVAGLINIPVGAQSRRAVALQPARNQFPGVAAAAGLKSSAPKKRKSSLIFLSVLIVTTGLSLWVCF